MSINTDARSSIKNLCPWTVSFSLPSNNAGIVLGANKKTTVNNGELISLMENSNPMFEGTGEGNHARIYVENEDIRKHVGYESEDGKTKQFVLTDEECQRILDYKTFSTFKKHIEESVICNHEKAKLIEYSRKVKLNDYDRITFIEQYCGIPFRKE